MNYILANSICCCLQCCCKELFETLYKLLGKTAFIKTMYFVVYTTFFLILLAAFVFLRKWPFFMTYLADGIHCENSGDFDCITVSLIYRIVTAISIFVVFILTVMSLCSVRISHILNEGLFFSKFVVISVIFVVLLQFDNSMYEHLSPVYQWVSYVFLICQGIVIIDIGYTWGIKWATVYAENEVLKYAVLLIGATIVMFVLAIGMNIYGYVIVGNEQSYAESLGKISQCSQLPNILNTVFILATVFVQLLNFNKQNSLLTTSFLCIYISYWCFSSIYSSAKCNLVYDQLNETGRYQKSDFYAFGTGVSIFWLLLSTFGSIFGSTNKIESEYQHNYGYTQHVEFVELEQSHKQQTKSILQGKRSNSNSIDQSYYTGDNKRNWLIWHFFMLTMILYLSMVLTDWGSGNLITKKYSLNQNSYISKLFMASFTFVAYIWTLIAPRLFPDRNFYFV